MNFLAACFTISLLGVTTHGGEDIAGLVKEYYSGVLSGRVISYRLDIRRLPELKPGMEIVRLHGEENRDEPPRGSRICWIEVSEHGRKRDLPVTLIVSPVERVPVARTDIQPRTLFTNDMFSWEDVSTQNFGASHFATREELNSCWAKVRIPQGAVLTAKRMAPIPIVTLGQPLKMILRVGQIEVVAEGKALEDGRQGELIRVINMVNDAKMRARVESKGVVVVE
jgi:flagella basal body P-ring formation protein FlgA